MITSELVDQTCCWLIEKKRVEKEDGLFEMVPVYKKMSILDYILFKHPNLTLWHKFLIENGAQADQDNYLEEPTLKILFKTNNFPCMEHFFTHY